MSEAYNKAWNRFMNEMGKDTPDIEVEFAAAWRACKAQVLTILKNPLENADLSHETCDGRFIEKITSL